MRDARPVARLRAYDAYFCTFHALVMSTIKIATTIIAAAIVTACGDDTTIISTFSYTNVSASNVTMFETSPPDVETNTEATPTEGADETTGEPVDDTTTIGHSQTSAPDPTTGGEMESEESSGTTGPGEMSEPFPPLGCGRIIEALGRAPTDERYVVIASDGCPRASTLSIQFGVFGGPQPSTVVLGGPAGCEVYGGSSSVAAEMGRVVIEIPGVQDPTNYNLTLFVDDQISDVLVAPLMLEGNAEWPEAPMAPLTPVHRRSDWSWEPIGAPLPACSLL